MEKNYKVEINNIIALCHIIDNFKEFEKNLLPIISPKYNRNFVFKLCDISQNKFKIGAKKAKKFYNENKQVIDTINKYSNVPTFINLNYDYYGKSNGNLEFFYEYISNHTEEIPNILKLLEKLKELGFSTFIFNENLDFTKETYFSEQRFSRNFNFTYVANPEIRPNYFDHISYKTSDSNYKIDLKINVDEISKYGNKITLNSLLFDPNTLPEKLDKKHTFDPLLSLKQK